MSHKGLKDIVVNPTCYSKNIGLNVITPTVPLMKYMFECKVKGFVDLWISLPLGSNVLNLFTQTISLLVYLSFL